MISFTVADTIVEITFMTRQSSKKPRMMYKYFNVQKIPVNYWAFYLVEKCIRIIMA